MINQKENYMKTFATLEEATKCAPNKMGCYQIAYKGHLVYVGKAEAGLRKRFLQYYNGTTNNYLSGSMINMNKNDITVKWKVLDSKEAVRLCEDKWIRQYKPLWNSQSGWGSKNSLTTGITPAYVGNVKVMTPEMAIGYCFANAIKESVKGAVGIAALEEIGKSIARCEDITDCAGNVVSKSAEAAVTGTTSAVAGELAAYTAVLLGAGPFGMALSGIGGALVAGGATREVVGGAFDDVGSAVTNAAENVCMGLWECANNIGSLFTGLFI